MTKIIKYRKKPVVIEAIQWTGATSSTIAVLKFIGQGVSLNCESAFDAFERFHDNAVKKGLDIETLEDGQDKRAKHVASVGDFIIKGVQGEFYPCKPDIFDSTYEEMKNEQ